MPQVTIQGFGRINFPDSMTPEKIEAVIRREIEPVVLERRQAMQKDMERMADPLAGTSASYRAVAGYGKAMPDIIRGIGQTLGLVSREDVAEARRRDEPLMRSGAGMAGNIAGNIAALVPTAAIPGATTLRGAGAIGAGIGAISPSASTEETAANVLGGAALGAGGQAVAGRIARHLRGAPKGPEAEAFRAAQEAGFTIPPSQAPEAGLISRAAEGFAGKLTTAQRASLANQQMTNRLARETLGLAEDAPLNLVALANLRRQAGTAYESVKRAGTMNSDDEFLQDLARIGEKYKGAEVDFPGLGKTPISDVIDSLKQSRFSSSGAVDAISILRDKADVAFRQGDKGLGRAFREAAKAMEDVVERNLETIASETGAIPKAAGQMLKDFRSGREMIAKTYSVEKALNESTGNVSAQVLAQELKRGKPLSGGLRTAAQVGRAFPKAVQRPEVIGSQPGISPLDIVGSGIFGGAGAAAGGPVGLLAAAIPFLRPAVRSAILSKPYQRTLGGAGLLSRIPNVQGNEALLEEMIRRSAVPLAIGAGQ